MKIEKKKGEAKAEMEEEEEEAHDLSSGWESGRGGEDEGEPRHTLIYIHSMGHGPDEVEGYSSLF